MTWPTRDGQRAGTAFRTLLRDAGAEVARRGERRLGTDHLLLALLHDPDSSAAEALGVTLAEARAAADGLDLAALAAIGLAVGPNDLTAPLTMGRRLPPLTSGAREVLKQALDTAKPRATGRFEPAPVLLALLARRRPDPAADVLHALGVDPVVVRARLSEPTGGGGT
jgi:ATP-dependent Clp protease ATP-binding subunit ClpA